MFKKASLEDQLFNLKFTSKSLQRNAKKCEKNEQVQKSKVKKAIEQGNMEGAKVYAQNAIREKTQALSYLQLASRIDAVASRVETAMRMGSLTKDIQGVVSGMGTVLGTMDVEKISKTMDKFEKQFDDLEVRSSYMSQAMASSTASGAPVEEVDNLIEMVAAENQLALGDQLDAAGRVGTRLPPAAAPVEEKKQAVTVEDDLAARLAALRK